MENARRSLLKMYLLTLIAEGQLAGATTAKLMLAMALRVLNEDMHAVGTEVFAMFVESQGRRAASAVRDKLEDLTGAVASRFAKEGLAAVGSLWADAKKVFNGSQKRGSK